MCNRADGLRLLRLQKRTAEMDKLNPETRASLHRGPGLWRSLLPAARRLPRQCGPHGQSKLARQVRVLVS